MKKPHRPSIVLLSLGALLLAACSAAQVVRNPGNSPIRAYTTDVYLVALTKDPRDVMPKITKEFEAMGFKVTLLDPHKRRGGKGTGFVISQEGHVLTCAHIIGDETTATLLIAGARYEADVLDKDADKDLALLKIRRPGDGGLVPVSFRSSKRYDIGTDVFTMGFPLSSLLGSSIRLTKGSVSSMTGLRDDPQQIQFSAQMQPGNGGGPLFDKDGVVLGVVSHSLDALTTVQSTGGWLPQNINFAIKGDVVLDYLAAVDNDLYRSMVFDRNGDVDALQKSVAKVRSGIVTEEWERRPKLLVRLDYSSVWDVWHKFRYFSLRFFDFDSKDFLFAAGQDQINHFMTEDQVVEKTFAEVRKVLRERVALEGETKP